MNESFKEHIEQSLKAGVRLDGRKSDEFRPIEIETGCITTAEGSARVKCGDAEVIAGIKLGIGSPFADRPDDGVLIVNVELLPLSSPEFEPGPPGEKAIEITRVIDRGIRESGAVDLKSLCIEKGEKVWLVNIDVCPVNTNGNLLDIGALAALSALQDAKFPKIEEDGTVNYKQKTDKQISINFKPVCVTVIKLGDNLIVDPTADEEKSADARLTITMRSEKELCALQKGGPVPLSIEEIGKMMEIAKAKTVELRKHIR